MNRTVENLSKRKFLELLKTTVNKEGEESNKKKLMKSENKTEGKSNWEILEDDYLMKPKTKKEMFKDDDDEDEKSESSSSSAPSVSESDD